MKNIAVMSVALALFSQHASGMVPLGDLINQNVKDASGAYQKTLPAPQRATEPVQLWVHIRSASQKPLAEEILGRVAKARPGAPRIEQKPVQTVDSGPRNTQLRFFKKPDEAQARELFEILRPLIPQLELKDLSRDYGDVGWIKPGHFELWLSPDLQRLQPNR